MDIELFFNLMADVLMAIKYDLVLFQLGIVLLKLQKYSSNNHLPITTLLTICEI